MQKKEIEHIFLYKGLPIIGIKRIGESVEYCPIEKLPEFECLPEIARIESDEYTILIYSYMSFFYNPPQLEFTRAQDLLRNNAKI